MKLVKGSSGSGIADAKVVDVVSPEDSALGGAPPLSVTELARLVGMSATFIRTEIRGGQLRAVAFGRGKRRVFRITAAEARRYAKSLGLVL